MRRGGGCGRCRIALLEGRVENERDAQREADYKAAVAKIEAALPRRQKAAEQVERALAKLAGSVKEYMVATEGVLKVWPEGR